MLYTQKEKYVFIHMCKKNNNFTILISSHHDLLHDIKQCIVKMCPLEINKFWVQWIWVELKNLFVPSSSFLSNLFCSDMHKAYSSEPAHFSLQADMRTTAGWLLYRACFKLIPYWQAAGHKLFANQICGES